MRHIWRMKNAVYLLASLLLFAACGGESAGQTAPSTGPWVEQTAPNADGQTPAFPDQTRAPERRTNVSIRVEEIATGLEHPWALAFLPDGRLLVTEQPGRLRVITRTGQISAPVAGLPAVDARGQGGLLDVVLSPTFAQDRLIYWSFSEPRGNGENGTSVARGRLNADATAVENVQVIFQQRPAFAGRGHYGSRLVFDRAGHLFVTLGERQRTPIRDRAQDLAYGMGKVMRINADGSVPSDNPYVGRAGVQPEIWSYGHRNVQGADLNPATGDLWTIEHGPQGGDELNIPRPGRNYGWPIITYGEDYDGTPIGRGITAQEGMEQPIYYWDPVIAPGDMDFYRGSLFPWQGDILIAALRGQALVRLDLEGERVVGEERLLRGQVGRLRDLAESEDGAIWVVTDEDNGRLLRLTPEAAR